MVQVAQMPDAEVACLEDEDRVAPDVRAARVAADVRWDIADPHILQRDVVLGVATLGVPAAQDISDRGIGVVGVVGRVGPVHGDDLGDHGRAHVVVVVGRDANAALRLEQERRVPT